MKAFMPSYQLFLKNNCQSYKTNIKRLQSCFSNACGKYCLVFLLYCSKGVRLENFLKKFSDSNYEKNDKLIEELYKKNFLR